MRSEIRQRAAAATAMARILQDSGYVAVMAGGCVRDLHLGVEPNDFDLATSATPERVKQVFAGRTAILCGESFGVVKIRNGDETIDIATLRADGQYGDGRRPDSVSFVTDLRTDAERRDFTINAMFLDPVTSKVYDFFGGIADLDCKILRAVGVASHRIAEDRLRMLRAARFAARLRFAVDPALRLAICEQAQTIEQVSAERIAKELSGILTTKHPLIGLDFMMETGLMLAVLWEVVSMDGPEGEQTAVWHPEGNTWRHTRLVVQELAGSSFELMLGGLLHDIGKPETQEFVRQPQWPAIEQYLPNWLSRALLPCTWKITNNGHAQVGAEMADAICRRLKLTNEQTRRVFELVNMHMEMHVYSDPKIRRSKLTRLLQRPDIQDLIALQHADVMGTGLPDAVKQSKSNRDYYLGKLAELATAPVTERPGAKALVTGDTIAGFGLKPGPIFRVVKDAALDAQLNGEFADADSGKQWLAANLERLLAAAGHTSN